ncbi:MAG: lipoate--protein ligase family protein [Planctomycetota bacterium]
MFQLPSDYGAPAGQAISAAHHLAVDEAGLLWADDRGETEWIRLWQFESPVVVIGRSSRISDETDRDFCSTMRIPVLRRCSGGASIVAGPGCLMYSVVLSIKKRPELRKIDAAHSFVIGHLLQATRPQFADVRHQGTCDLTWLGQKFSGNSMRVARNHILYHGTILYAADLDLIEQCLSFAPRQPDYRVGRSHRNFVVNLCIDPHRWRQDLLAAFQVTQPLTDDEGLRDRIDHQRQHRYDSADWHDRH